MRAHFATWLMKHWLLSDAPRGTKSEAILYWLYMRGHNLARSVC